MVKKNNFAILKNYKAWQWRFINLFFQLVPVIRCIIDALLASKLARQLDHQSNVQEIEYAGQDALVEVVLCGMAMLSGAW